MQNTWELAVDEDDKRTRINMRSGREMLSRITRYARHITRHTCRDYIIVSERMLI